MVFLIIQISVSYTGGCDSLRGHKEIPVAGGGGVVDSHKTDKISDNFVYTAVVRGWWVKSSFLVFLFLFFETLYR